MLITQEKLLQMEARQNNQVVSPQSHYTGDYALLAFTTRIFTKPVKNF